jgi:glucose-1-phosphate cytidylyltransferase
MGVRSARNDAYGGAQMRVVLLAGGFGTRLSEETEETPKPMIEIGGRPILWHIMKGYAKHGLRHFVVALGYKGESVKRFFLDYPQLSATSLSIDIHAGEAQVNRSTRDDWHVDLVDTGMMTDTGSRVGRLRDWLVADDLFCLTYGDGVSDVDVGELVRFHRGHGRAATLTAVRPPARFGELGLDGDEVCEFAEKPSGEGSWINGGFMVLNRSVLERLQGDNINLERDLLSGLAREGQLMAFRHKGFWQCMDTLRDVRYLRQLWSQGNAPWKTWHDD